jgi:predicted DCC family thiol-disulfide oxidoreductase YuxK
VLSLPLDLKIRLRGGRYTSSEMDDARPYLVFYDARCRICRRGRQTVERLRPTAAVRFVDSNDAREMARHPEVDARGQMYVLDPAGRLSGGYDAMVALAPILPAFAWLGGLLGIGPVRALGRWAYRWLAANRYRLGGQAPCHAGACEIH